MPKQTTLVGWGIDVQPAGDDGVALVFIDQQTNDVIVAPMPKDLAQQIGRKLTAPSIEIGNSSNVQSILRPA